MHQSSPYLLQLEKSPCSNHDSVKPKINNKIIQKKKKKERTKKNFSGGPVAKTPQ